jgi:hypothetical protein
LFLVAPALYIIINYIYYMNKERNSEL